MRIDSKHIALVALMVLLSAVALALPTADDPEVWKGLAAEQIAKVKAGEIVIVDEGGSEGGDQARFIKAAMIFDRPIDEVWPLIRKTENQHRFLPDLEKCALVKRTNDGDLVDFHVELFMLEIDYRINHHYDDANYYLHWHLDPTYDNDMNRVDGFWRLYKLDDKRTLARYGTQVVVASFVPDYVMEKLTRSNLPANLEAYHKYVQSGGAYTKPGFKE